MILWCDVETTGLNFDEDVLLEVAFVLTDDELEVLGEFYSIVCEFDVETPWTVLPPMNPNVVEMHTKSGLLADLLNPPKRFHPAKKIDETVAFLMNAQPAEPLTIPLGGSNVSFDREFLRRYLPETERLLSYRNIDVSSIKELVTRWFPEEQKERKSTEGPAKHRAYDDILATIEELKFYRRNVFKEDVWN